MIEWFNWYSIIQCLKKCKIKKEDQDYTEYEILRIGNTKLESAYTHQIYNLFLKIYCKQREPEIRATKYVEIGQDEKIESIFNRCHKYGLDTYTKAFQYKFLYDILVNNYWLTKWKIQENSICTFCEEREENIHHMYWKCKHIKVFWSDFNIWINNFISVDTNARLVFYGTENKLLYTLIIVAKLYIYACRKNTTEPDINKYKFKVKYQRKLEQHTGMLYNKIDLVQEKWEPLSNF